MAKEKLKLAVIVGSNRKGRFGSTPARWFAGQVEQRKDIEMDYIDLAELDLGNVLDSGLTEARTQYLDRLDRAEAFVIVTPEYNHGYPAPLKHAIDLGKLQWRAKPIGFVSYGGLAGGVRAVEQLRQVFVELHAMTIRDLVSFHSARQKFNPDGSPIDAEGTAQATKLMLDELIWWAKPLTAARANTPYPTP